jgi:hypothetical protein
MTDTPLYVGTVVHKTISEIISRAASGHPVDMNAAVNRALDMFRTGWKESSDARWLNNPKHAVNLLEHYYGLTLTSAEKHALHDRIVESVKGFYAFEDFPVITSLPPDDLLGTDESLDAFLLDNLNVYARPDLTVRRNNSIIVYDWKTGEPDDHSLQLGTYALYAMAKWNAPEHTITTGAVFLRSRPVSSTQSRLSAQQTRDFIHRSADAMKAALDDPQRNIASKDRFPMTTDTRRCGRCPFREICHP